MEGEPVHVDLAKVGASDGIPVGLSILGRRDSEVLGFTAHGPSSLGDPDVLRANSTLHGRESIVEQASSRFNRVRHAVLEVGVGVHADPVKGFRDSRVGGVGPSSPGVNVADGDFAQGSAGNGRSDLLDVADEFVRRGAGARLGCDSRRGDAVEILAADGDTDDEIGEVCPPLLDGRLESGEFSLDLAVASRGPDSEEKSGILRDGGWDGRGWIVGRATTLLGDCQPEA